ncbi:hypothetical protein AAKU64_000027 [Undibacterium sp. GrIS 1.8]|uniref:TniQ family protein n=1 Tax=unclassified Undibacterium TaxID=2630295 RepID=UPI0033924889
MSVECWLMRPKPLEDELLSSWIVRIAWENVEKLESMSSKLWGTHSQVWSKDVDRFAGRSVIDLVAEKCGVSIARANQTSLRTYEGILYETHGNRGAARWIMPIGSKSRKRSLFGLQCCPHCLKEDIEPYYRRNWRLAFVTICSKHRTLLIDRCDQCGSSITFHQSDFGSFELPDDLRMTFCKKCGRDYRDIEGQIVVSHILGPWVEYFQKTAEMVMFDRWVALSKRIEVPSVMFFEGVRHLIRTLGSNSYASKLRSTVLENFNLPSAPLNYVNGIFFERLALTERFLLIGIMGWLLSDWPVHLIDSAKKARLSSSYFQIYQDPVPYWLAMPIEWDLKRTWYKPNKQEIEAVVRYLDGQGLPINRNSLRKWLGRWYVSRHKKEKVCCLDSEFPLRSHN